MNTHTTIAPVALEINNISITQDYEGRYCLNDLHKAAIAAGVNSRTKEPAKFLASPQTQDLIFEYDTQNLGIKAIDVVKGRGKAQGTYVVKELVYAYAMWISAAFHLQVIRAYDALCTGALPNGACVNLDLINSRSKQIRDLVAVCKEHRLAEPPVRKVLTRAVKQLAEELGFYQQSDWLDDSE